MKNPKCVFAMSNPGRRAGVILALLLAASLQSAQAQSYTDTTLYAFQGGKDGANPDGNLLADSAGNLYSTTDYGGDASCGATGVSGCGVAFQVTQKGKETTIHAFTGMPDGDFPNVGLAADKAGNGYGVTGSGGLYGYGVVFKVAAKTGKETILHSFTGGADGAEPDAFLTLDSAGNLHGTTQEGGNLTCNSLFGATGCGVVFKLNPATGVETVLYTFTGGADGANPIASVLLGANGNIYGTTAFGGDPNCSLVPGYGCGVVFKLDNTGEETPLYAFTGPDGAIPDASLSMDKAGNLYSATGNGGAYGYGTIFELGKTGETVLYSFTGGADGATPDGGLIADSAGNFYSTALAGGNLSCTNLGSTGCGVVFKFNPKTRIESVLHSFSGSDGASPGAALLRDNAGNFYGTAFYGGNPACTNSGGSGCGVVFKLSPK